MRKVHQFFFLILLILLPVQLGRHFWPEWSYVLGLKIDYLAPTIYLTDILVVGILLFWMLENTSEVFSRLRRGFTSEVKQGWWIIAIFLYLFTTSLLAQNPGAALYKFIKIIEFSFLGFYVAKNKNSLFQAKRETRFSDESRRFLFIIRNSLFIPIIYSSFIALAQFLKQASLGGVFWWLGERTFNAFTPGIAKAVIGGRLVMRPYATFPHPNALAGFILAALLLIGISNYESGITNALKWLAIGIGSTAVAISFSRSVWLVGLLVLSLILLERLRVAKLHSGSEARPSQEDTPGVFSRFLFFGKGRKLFVYLFCILLLVALVVILFLRLPFSTEEALDLRLQSARVAISMIRQQPLVGVGLNNFVPQLPNYWQAPETIRFLQPVHNIFLLVAAETGLVGLTVFLWLLILTYKRHLRGVLTTEAKHHLGGGSRRLLRTDNLQLLLSLSVILALGLFDHYWLTLQQTQLLLAIVLGFSWAERTAK